MITLQKTQRAVENKKNWMIDIGEWKDEAIRCRYIGFSTGKHNWHWFKEHDMKEFEGELIFDHTYSQINGETRRGVKHRLGIYRMIEKAYDKNPIINKTKPIIMKNTKKLTEKGISTTKNLGEEKYETFKKGKRTYYQYDYRHMDGQLFSCVKSSLKVCRMVRDKWIEKGSSGNKTKRETIEEMNLSIGDIIESNEDLGLSNIKRGDQYTVKKILKAGIKTVNSSGKTLEVGITDKGFNLVSKKAPVKIKKAKTKKDILNHPAVESMHNEGDDGWWIHLKKGWINTNLECGIIHEHTIKDCIQQLNDDVKRDSKESLLRVEVWIQKLINFGFEWNEEWKLYRYIDTNDTVVSSIMREEIETGDDKTIQDNMDEIAAMLSEKELQPKTVQFLKDTGKFDSKGEGGDYVAPKKESKGITITKAIKTVNSKKTTKNGKKNKSNSPHLKLKDTSYQTLCTRLKKEKNMCFIGMSKDQVIIELLK